MNTPQEASAVIRFWFEEITPSHWWKKDEEFDKEIEIRFSNIHRAANAGELFAWRDSVEGSLAEVIVLDQFSRNIYRDQAAAFASDALALVLAQEAIRRGQDQDLSPEKRAFLYMPFMHSESLAIHEQAVSLFSQTGMESNLNFEYRHKAIIERFGRYPHRNTILGRPSTQEEMVFLTEPGSSF